MIVLVPVRLDSVGQVVPVPALEVPPAQVLPDGNS
jgi:hypothetical protein